MDMGSCGMFNLSTVVCLFILTSSTMCQNLPYGSGASISNVNNSSSPLSSGGFELQSFLSSLSHLSYSDVVRRAGEALQKLYLSGNVSSNCLKDLQVLFDALMSGQQWALRMVDAMGKPHTGLLEGDLTWLGSYDECVATEATVNISGEITHPYGGRYCTSSFTFEGQKQIITQAGGITLSVGACVPSSCNNEDLTGLIRMLISLVPYNTSGLPEPEVSCQMDAELDTRAVIAIFICSLFGLVIAAATAYDIIVVQWLEKRKTTKQIAQEKVPNGNMESGNVSSVDDYVKPKLPDTDYTAELTKMDVMSPKPDDSNIQRNQGVSTRAILLSFSLYTNASKILNTKQPSGTLTAVNGIRFISMTWVILGHTFVFGLPAASNVGAYGPEVLKRFTFQAIKNALVSVDTFFTLSGLLVAYLSLKEMRRLGGAKKFKWGMFYFHRFWRLTPPYMLFMMVYVCLMRYWSDGPQWPQGGNNQCHSYWWRNLLYINNLFKFNNQIMTLYTAYKNEPCSPATGRETWLLFSAWDMSWSYRNPYFSSRSTLSCLKKLCLLKSENDHEMSQSQTIDQTKCMGWSWYLANDMQFYVLSPLMLIPLYYSAVLGALSCGALLLVCFISTGIISSDEHLATNVVFDRNGNAADDYYVKPWCRIGPYIVGFVAGYILYRLDCKLKIPKIINLIGWLLAAAIAILVLYGTYDSSGVPKLSNTASAIYNATARTGWGVAMAWVIVACATGNGGFINTFLSWRLMIPLSRLTYCAYLVHPIVIYTYLLSRRTKVYFTDLESIYLFCGHLVISYAVAFGLSLAFESPMMGLEKALLRRKKNN